MPDKLEEQVAYMNAYREIALVHSRVACIDETGARISWRLGSR